VRVLLEHGARPNGTNALAHALDVDGEPHVRLLLEHGADPNKAAFVAHAVRRERGPEFLRVLAEFGANVDQPGGETWRGDVPLRTPYQHAALRNRVDQLQALAELGASTEVAPEDLAVAAVARGEHPATPLPEHLDPDAQEVLILAALRGRIDAVVETFGPGFRGVVGGSPEGTLLHHAAWVGKPEILGDLLARGGRSPVRLRELKARPRWRGSRARRSTGSCRGATTSRWPNCSPTPATRSTGISSTLQRAPWSSGSRSGWLRAHSDPHALATEEESTPTVASWSLKIRAARRPRDRGTHGP
jgi:hypothetical protein